MQEESTIPPIQKMITTKVALQRVDDAFHFEATGVSNIPIQIDGAVAIGGHNAGARPMELLLMGLAGCSAIDIALILQKQRQHIEDFQISVEGQHPSNEIPSPFSTIHLHYVLKGNLDENKVRRVIDLSINKYCSAAAQLRPTAQLTYSFSID